MHQLGPMANRIRLVRNQKRLSREALAKLVGCHPQTIRKLEDGTLKFGEQWHLPIANALGVRVADVLPENYFVEAERVLRLVPVVEWNLLGREMDVIERSVDASTPRVATALDINTLIAVVMPDSSMNRVAPQGSALVVDIADHTIEDDAYVIVRLADGGLFFRRLRTENGPFRLEADSTEAWPTIFPNGSIEVLGRVRQITRLL